MKIVQAAGWYFPDSLGGTEVYVAALAHRLQAAGHDVQVAAPRAGACAEETYRHDGIDVYRYPIPTAPTRAECQGATTVRGAERFHAWLAAAQPDIVHVHTFVTGLGLAELRAARAVGARVVVTPHSASLGYVCQRGTMMRWGERLCDGRSEPTKCAGCVLQSQGVPRPLARVLAAVPPAVGRWLGRTPMRLGTALGMSALIRLNQARQAETLAVVERLVTLTDWAHDALVRNDAPPGKLAVNRLGVDDVSAPPKPGPAVRSTMLPVRVGYLGRFEPIKGVHDLARAVASLPARMPIRVEFRGPDGDELARSVVRDLRALVGADTRVTWAPPVLPRDVPRVLAEYDVLCCPSICLEGGPTVALEAHAAGTPVIGTRIGGLAELITDGVNGRLVPPGDWRALAGVLVEIAADPACTVDRWRDALPPVRSMDEVVKDYLDLYAA